MIEKSLTTVANEVAQKISGIIIETMRVEVAELPEKLGELSEVEALPDKIELISELPTINKTPNEDIPSSQIAPLEKVVYDSGEGEYLSTYKERIDRTPSENSDRGEWTGERGESTYIPSDEAMKELLAKYGLEGIEYHDGIPDFSQCSECTVEIDNMTENRADNFAQCDEKCAEQWNKEARDGKTD